MLRVVTVGLSCLVATMVALEVKRGLDGLDRPIRFGTIASPSAGQPPAAGRLQPYRLPGFPGEHASVTDKHPAGRPPSAPDRAGKAYEASPMTFRIGADSTILARGTIVPGTASRLEQFLKDRDELHRIQLHSPGGSVRDAIAIARLIRDRGLETRIAADGYCASSCPLVFAGGTRRTVHREALIGVHQVYARAGETGSLEQGMDEAQRITARAQALLLDLGVDPRMWIRAMQTPPNNIYLLTMEEITGFRLATRIED